MLHLDGMLTLSARVDWHAEAASHAAPAGWVGASRAMHFLWFRIASHGPRDPTETHASASRNAPRLHA